MVFCHISTRISHRYTRVPSLPNLSHLPLHPTPQPVLETLLEFPESYSSFKPAFSFSFTVTWSCPILCMPIDCSLPGSSVHGISQIKILEWVSISSSRESSQPSDQICVFYTVVRFLHAEPLGKLSVSFRCTAKWFCYAYTCIYSFSNSLPI